MDWKVNGLLSRYVPSTSASFFSHSRGWKYQCASRSITRPVRTGSVRSNGSMVSRSLEIRCSVPSTFSGPTNRRICSNACGQSSSAPSSNPIRWSCFPAMLSTLTTGRRCHSGFSASVTSVPSVRLVPLGALGGVQHVGAAAGGCRGPGCRSRRGIDGGRGQVRRRADRARVGDRDAARQEVDDDLVGPLDLLVHPSPQLGTRARSSKLPGTPMAFCPAGCPADQGARHWTQAADAVASVGSPASTQSWMPSLYLRTLRYPSEVRIRATPSLLGHAALEQ